MASVMSNWVFNKDEVRKKDLKALSEAKIMEKNDEKKGYRWIKINNRLSIHVPCDKDGNPTKKGLEKIKKLKEYERIK